MQSLLTARNQKGGPSTCTKLTDIKGAVARDHKDEIDLLSWSRASFSGKMKGVEASREEFTAKIRTEGFGASSKDQDRSFRGARLPLGDWPCFRSVMPCPGPSPRTMGTSAKLADSTWKAFGCFRNR